MASRRTETPRWALKPQLFLEAPKASDAVLFYKGAEEVNRVTHPKKKVDQELPLVMSAELKLGSSTMKMMNVLAQASVVHFSNYLKLPWLMSNPFGPRYFAV